MPRQLVLDVELAAVDVAAGRMSEGENADELVLAIKTSNTVDDDRVMVLILSIPISEPPKQDPRVRHNTACSDHSGADPSGVSPRPGHSYLLQTCIKGLW